MLHQSGRFMLVKVGIALLGVVGLAQSASAPGASAKMLTTRPLVGIPGKEGTLLLVEYPPGVSTPSHRHNANTFVYVLEGEVIMQVAGGPEMRLKKGDTFYELPSDVHSVSKNASATEWARFVAFVVKDEGAPVTLPVK